VKRAYAFGTPQKFEQGLSHDNILEGKIGAGAVVQEGSASAEVSRKATPAVKQQNNNRYERISVLNLLRKTAQRRLFVGKLLENLRQVRNFQDLFDLWRQTDHSHGTTLFHDGNVNARQFADAGAIQIFQFAQVQQNIVSLFAQQRLHGIAQRAHFKKSQVPGDIDERNMVLLADLHGKAHEE